MKLIILCIFIASLLLLPSRLTVAQGPTPTPVPTAKLPDDVLVEAQRAADSADRAMNTVNTLLSFIQGAAIILGALAAGLTALATAAGFRTLREYSQELTSARADLAGMRQQLQEQANAIRDQSVKSIRALSLLQLGEQQLETKNMTAALKTYQEAYALDPDNPATNYFLGHIYIQERNLEKGIEHLKRAISNSGNYAPAEAALAYALRLQADKETDMNRRSLGYAESERMFLKALADDPAVLDINGESVYAVLGGLYKRQSRIRDAIRAYQDAERITPQKSYPIVNLAMLNFVEGNVAESTRYFTRSSMLSARTLDSNPSDYWTRFDLTIALLVLGQMAQAEANLNLALQLVTSTGPLEIFLADLQRLKNAPEPPENVESFITQVQNAIKRLKEDSRVRTP